MKYYVINLMLSRENSRRHFHVEAANPDQALAEAYSRLRHYNFDMGERFGCTVKAKYIQRGYNAHSAELQFTFSNSLAAFKSAEEMKQKPGYSEVKII